ncbi:MAG: SGNH/GDSL hydrolase family protein [Bacteroidales bacterium]|nr:SGNH/GDSL hydrolase family protein [Bacteroidales bacterium]
MGDSITHCGHYHSYIWLFYMTRFPEMRLQMINAGLGGECSWDMLERLQSDVFDRNPDYVTLTFGMNDTGYFDVFASPDSSALSAERISRSLESFHKMEGRLAQAPNMNVVMIGGSPYDESSKFNDFTIHGKNNAMRAVISEQKAAAQRHGWGFVDFHEPMIELSLREQEKDSTFSFCRLERVHPDCDGQMVMAYLFLKAQGLAGSKVADISLRAGRKKPLRSENCTISNISGGKDGISFDYLAKSLPYPLDTIAQNGWGNKKSARDAMGIVPFMEEFNQEQLQVEGLAEGSYRLAIDGQEIAVFSQTELAGGVNLAEYVNTPQYRQATAVMYLNEDRLLTERRLLEYLWVEYEYLRKAGMLYQDDQKAVDYLNEIAKKDFFLSASMNWWKQGIYPEVRKTWSDNLKNLEDTIHSMNKPVSHRISIEKI